MQVIGARPGSSCRYNLPLPDRRREPLALVDVYSAPDGSPWVVVDDYTDFPAQARQGYVWVLDIDPDSRNYGDAIEVPANGRHHGARITEHWQEYLNARSQLYSSRRTAHEPGDG